MEYITLTKDNLAAIQKAEEMLVAEVDRICEKHGLRYFVAYGSLIGAVRHKGFIPWDDDIDICMPRKDYLRFREICKTELNEQFFYQTHSTDPDYYYLYDKIRINGTVFKESFLSKRNIHHGIFLDIFPVDMIADDPKAFWWQFKVYRICRAVLMSKYLVLSARKGKKKVAAALIRLLTIPVSLEWLYHKAEQAAQSHNDSATKCGLNFFSGAKTREIFPVEWFTQLQRTKFEEVEVNIPTHYDEMLTAIFGNYMQPPPEDQRGTRHDLVELKLRGSEKE